MTMKTLDRAVVLFVLILTTFTTHMLWVEIKMSGVAMTIGGLL